MVANKKKEPKDTPAQARAHPSFVDTAWFKAQLERQGLSMRRLAGLVGMDVSAVSLMLNGKRKMSASEAGGIAHHLGCSVEDVLRHAGVEVPPHSEDKVKVGGWVDEEGLVHEGRAPGPEAVSGPLTVLAGIEALRVKGGRANGWTLFYRKEKGVAPEAVGNLCVVEPTGQKKALLRFVEKGWEPGVWSLGLCEKSEIEQSRLVTASPVLWIKP